MNISLQRFLATGELGDLRLGMSMEQVRALLGPPDDTGGTSRKYPRPTIYVYGTVELFFTQKKPILCHAAWWYAHRGEFRLTSNDTVEDWGLAPGMQRIGVEANLNATRLPFQCPAKPSPAIATTLTLPSGAIIAFDEDDVLYAVFTSAVASTRP